MNKVFESNGYKVFSVNNGEYFCLEQEGMLVSTFKTESGAIKSAKRLVKKYFGIEA